MLLGSFENMQESPDIQRKKHLGVYTETVRAYLLSKRFLHRGKREQDAHVLEVSDKKLISC